MGGRAGSAARRRNEAVMKEMEKIRELLKEFGLQLYGYDPGITAFFTKQQVANNPMLGFPGRGYWGEPISFSSIEWAWLRPLLEELRERRQSQGECSKLPNRV